MVQKVIVKIVTSLKSGPGGRNSVNSVQLVIILITNTK